MAAPPTETLRDLDVAATSHRGDRIFNRGITVAAFTALLVLAGIAIFLGIAAVEAITTQGWSFLFTTEWKVDQGDEPVAGIWGMLYGSVLLAVIGLVLVPTARGDFNRHIEVKGFHCHPFRGRRCRPRVDDLCVG